MKNSTFSAQVANNLLTLLQGYSKTIRLLLVMLLTLTVTTNAWAEDYSIKFLTAASDGSTEITSSTRTSTVLENASCDYVTGFTSNCTKAYYKGKSGVKLSSSKASGTLEFNLADICKQNVSKIVFKTVQYSDESSTLTFYAGSTSLGTTTSGTTFTHTFNSSQEVSSIKITSSKRSYISEIIISTSGNAGGSTPTQLAAPTGLKANNITSSGATLSWNAVANASSYTLQVYGENDDVIAEYTGLTQTTKEVSGLEPETYYVWGVTAIGNGTTYEDSNEKTGEFTTSAAGGDGGECSWKETAIGDIQSTDIVVITMTNNSGSTYAMSNDKGTSSAPAATKVTVSGTKLTGTIADNLKWNISNSNGTLTIYPNETTSTWLYCTASNNGVRVGTNTNKTFTIDATSGYLKHVGTSRYLGVYNNADWRCYTNTTGNTANQTLKFYVYQCSGDGGDDPEPVIVKTLKSIEVTGMTTTFEQGDVFKFDGTCTATYSVTKDGAAQADETAEVTPTNVSTPDMNQIGTQTVYVTYSEGGVEKTDDYKITITENTVTAGEYCITPNNEFWGTNFNGSLSGEALNQTYTGRQDDITIQYAKGSSQYMYINDSQTRVYGNNSLTFSVPSGYVITAIAFTADGNNWDGTHTANAGSMTDSKNWAGSANEVTITFGDNCRITKICVTYEELDLTLPSAPTFTPAAGTYNAVQNVTISAEAGTTIYYTLDGTDPTTESNVYASAIEISETTTVKAIAVKDEKVSPVATATYTINLPLTTMDQIFAKATAVGSTATSVEITFDDWVVSAVKEDGKTAFVTDGTKGFVIYETGCGFNVGDILSGTAACKVVLYNGFAELTGLKSTTTGLSVATGGEINVVELDEDGIAALTGVNTGSLIKINGICSSSDSKYYVADVQIYTSLYNFGTLEVGAEYNITGIYQPYNSTKEILPRSAADIEKVVGLPTATIAIADITMEVGEEKDIEATITPDAAQTKVQYAITAGSEYIDLDGTTITAVAAGTATITATIAEAAGEYYGTTKTFNVTVKPQNIAVLPFTFDGGRDDIEATLGMSQDGLDSDYGSSPKLKFDGTGDYVIIHFNGEPGKLSYDIKGNGYSDGTFTVQESEDGSAYTNIVEYTELGSTETKTHALAATSRYVKFIYTEKVSGNVALGNIKIYSPASQLETPTGLEATNVTHNSATLSWGEVANASSYLVTIVDGGDLRADIPNTQTSHTFEGLTPSTEYLWTVKAIGDGITYTNSEESETGEFTTSAAASPATITLSELGVMKTISTYSVGDQYTLPTTSSQSCDGKELVGWSTVEVAETDTKPTENYYELGAKVTLAETQTFYAVFATSGEGGIDDTDYSNVHTSNVALDNTGGTNATNSQVKIGEIDYTAVKAGTGSASGAVKITVPTGTTKLSFHIAGWNKEGGKTISLTGATATPSSFTTVADAGVSGSSTTYTLSGTIADYFYSTTLSNINTETTLTFSNGGADQRFVIWGVNASTGGGVSYSAYTTSCGTYTVTFYGFNSGGYTTICNDNPAEIAVAQGETYQIPNCKPTDDPAGLGRTFAGTWNTQANGKGTAYEPGEEFIVNSNITLYAQWTLNTSENTTLPTDVEDLATTDIVVTGGKTLTIPEGETIIINSLTLKGGLIGDGKSGNYAMPSVWVPEGAKLVRKNTTINLDLVVNSKSWYPFAVPFAATINANVEYLEPTLAAASEYGTHFAIKTYDGARRAEEGVDQTNNWVQLNRNEKLQPGVGYIISALTYPNKDTATIRIPMTVDNAWLANGELTTVNEVTRNQVAVTAYIGAAATEHQRHAGWNFVANPYLSKFAGNNVANDVEYIKGSINIQNKYTYEDTEVTYVTVPAYNFAYYEQFKLSATKLNPEYSFFVQVGTDGTMTFETTGRQQAPASIAAHNAEERPVKMDVDITLSDNHSSDQTGIIISDRYSDAYEIGSDLEKLFGSAYNLSVYTLMADNTPLAFQALAIRSNMQVIPVGYRAPEQGEYTFRLNEATSSIDLLNEQYEQLVLVDYETGELTNLLVSDYTFYSERTQADNRFAIYAVPRQNAPTDLPNAIGQDKQAQKIIHNGHLYILRDGNVYNGNGQIVK